MGADSSFLTSVYRVGQVVFQGQGWGWVRSVYFALLLIPGDRDCAVDLD